MNLYQLAESGDLPLHQYMDEGSLNWIKDNNPFPKKVVTYFNLSIIRILDTLVNFTPKHDWFTLPEEVDGLHGLKHIMRVVTYASILSSDKYSKIILTASALHDICRLDDKGDHGHAKRAADWFKENISLVSESFQIKLSEDEIESVYYSILFHEIPYETIIDDANYIKHKNYIDIVKTADALDRYRLPKLKWWINDNLISIIPPDELKHFAFKFVVDSETEYLTSKNSIRSILDTLKSYDSK